MCVKVPHANCWNGARTLALSSGRPQELWSSAVLLVLQIISRKRDFILAEIVLIFVVRNLLNCGGLGDGAVIDLPADSATPSVSVVGQIGEKGLAPGSGGFEAEGPDVNKKQV